MLRDYIAFWREQGHVLDIHAPVQSRFEAAAITAQVQADTNQIVMFHRIHGYPLPVAMNIYGCRDRLRQMWVPAALPARHCLRPSIATLPLAWRPANLLRSRTLARTATGCRHLFPNCLS